MFLLAPSQKEPTMNVARLWYEHPKACYETVKPLAVRATAHSAPRVPPPACLRAAGGDDSLVKTCCIPSFVGCLRSFQTRRVSSLMPQEVQVNPGKFGQRAFIITGNDGSWSLEPSRPWQMMEDSAGQGECEKVRRACLQLLHKMLADVS